MRLFSVISRTHWLGESYPSPKMQSVYFTAPDKWVCLAQDLNSAIPFTTMITVKVNTYSNQSRRRKIWNSTLLTSGQGVGKYIELYLSRNQKRKKIEIFFPFK